MTNELYIGTIMGTRKCLTCGFHDPECKCMVEHPSYYQGKSLGIEVINVIEDFNLGFRLGNAIKYLLRAGKKESRIDDLKKAVWYINREIDSE